MHPSNVSGGFWLQNPVAITDLLGHNDKFLDIQMECMEPCQRKERYEATVSGSQTRWAVRYLTRKGGSGMSGGWIYFAIDHVSATCLIVYNAATILVFVASAGLLSKPQRY